MRLIIVSNRLPVSVAVNDGVVAVTRSVGGLATGMSAYVERLKGQSSADFPVNHLSDVLPEVVWVGWPGADIAEGLREQVSSSLRDAGAVPIFVPSELRDRFYNGFCNQTLWPLFHYFSSLVSYDEEDYRAYVEVNALFADALAGMLKPGDVVWVHDYHLLLLPAMLRERFPDLAIGFFLHIPFPDFELFQLLPKRWRESLLEGVLGADVVGFHTYDYTQHFLQCALRILGIEHKMGTLLLRTALSRRTLFRWG
jgi:trehalose 6-phosphate synthase/phosphatase